MATYALVGNGGIDATATDGGHSGSHTLTARSGDIVFLGSMEAEATQAYAQVGNGGAFALGDHRGNHTLDAGTPSPSPRAAPRTPMRRWATAASNPVGP